MIKKYMKFFNTTHNKVKSVCTMILVSTVISSTIPMSALAADYLKVVNYTSFDADGTYTGTDENGLYYSGNIYDENTTDYILSLNLPNIHEDDTWQDSYSLKDRCKVWRETDMTQAELAEEVRLIGLGRFTGKNIQYDNNGIPIPLPEFTQQEIDTIVAGIMTLPKNSTVTDYDNYYSYWG